MLGLACEDMRQVRDVGISGEGEPGAEVVPEGDAELCAGLCEAEKGVAAVTAGVAACSAADFSLGDLAADVVLGSVGVERDLRTIEDHEQFGLIGMKASQQPVESGEAGPTLEDPVEYKMDGVNQIQVNSEVGLTFASGLRSILRQDPNIIMVGEIRDAETANLAVQAALTGHLVFSTLHTNSAAGVLPRLLDMGIEPFLIASTVNTIIGQRLVRRVSPKRDAYNSTPIETQNILSTVGHILPKTKEQVAQISQDLGYKDLPLAGQNAYTLVKGKDTPQTPRGYSGRAGLYEVMDVTEEIQNLIVARATSAEIQRKAIEQGMITMRQDGYLKALTGLTTLEEVNRVAAETA